VTLGLYETLVRRFRVTRFLFGMKQEAGSRAIRMPADGLSLV
jgi:hypothetical protein